MLMTLARRTAATLLALALGAAPALAPQAAHADSVRDRQRPVIQTLELEEAWKVTRGRGVTVAVVDSGVDPDQQDLAGAVTTGPNMLAEVDRGTRPSRMHGTGMASLIAGRGHGPGGRDGVIGVAPEARILGIRAIGEEEDPSYARYTSSDEAEDAVARGIRYAADHGADVINLSLGKDDENPAEREAIAYAIDKGVVVVAAVGNDGEAKKLLDRDGFAPYSYPAAYPGVIAVAATDPDHGHAAYSNRNYSVLLSAPGSGIPVAAPGGDYYITDGTSDSSALVAGIAALIRSRHPKLPPALVTQALLNSTRHGPPATYDPNVGFGEVSAARAVRAADALVAPRQTVGQPPWQRFGADDPGPVEVIDRPAWVRPLILSVTVLGIAGAAVAVAVAVALARRHPRNQPSPETRTAPSEV
ncbi:type VII secretion-associated serine protease mycosin [Actinomadura keratinilytica]|uniref:Type VII secretion-associated serine protease mycosin n=2 Tax=Actinomadura keratinilytica TaxID=547461 RepID=A0ABP7YCR5_9ACTN